MSGVPYPTGVADAELVGHVPVIGDMYGWEGVRGAEGVGAVPHLYPPVRSLNPDPDGVGYAPHAVGVGDVCGVGGATVPGVYGRRHEGKGVGGVGVVLRRVRGAPQIPLIPGLHLPVFAVLVGVVHLGPPPITRLFRDALKTGEDVSGGVSHVVHGVLLPSPHSVVQTQVYLMFPEEVLRVAHVSAPSASAYADVGLRLPSGAVIPHPSHCEVPQTEAPLKGQDVAVGKVVLKAGPHSVGFHGVVAGALGLVGEVGGLCLRSGLNVAGKEEVVSPKDELNPAGVYAQRGAQAVVVEGPQTSHERGGYPLIVVLL